MNRKVLRRKTESGSTAIAMVQPFAMLSGIAMCGALALLLAPSAAAQVTIDSKTGVVTNGDSSTTLAGPVDRRYAQVIPTKVELSKVSLDPKTRLEVIRIMQSEQGFAMRPVPRGHKGLTLNANGKLDPAGEGYLNMVTAEGITAKPGERVVLTDVKIEHSRIIFDLNGGPDHKHRFLRHVQLGTGPMMNPVLQGDDPDPTGGRITLAFKGSVPELTGSQVKSLLSPLISFDVKTPIQAYTDTLPPALKAAILDHHVLVGMSTDMVLFTLGQPDSKSREMEGQMPFEEWIYGKPPKDVQFVRINGNRVIRVELAKIGATPIVFTKDEVEGLMRTDGTPLETAKSNTKTVELGDVQRNPDTQAPATPPSLRKPGEAPVDKLPNDVDIGKGVGVMRPVQFPKSKSQEDSTGQPDGQQAPAPASPSTTAGVQPKPADGAAAPNPQPAADDASKPAPEKPQMFVPSHDLFPDSGRRP